jgi:alpha-galactosidase
MNKDMIAIDQDTLGVQGWHYCDKDGLQFWFKPLAGNDWAFTILNPTRQDIQFNLNWQDFNLTDDEVSGLSTSFDTKVYRVYNLWTHRQEGKTSLKNKPERKLVAKARDVISYRLTAK